MTPIPSVSSSSDHRFGLHYFPDTLHYRESDFHTWLPELQDLGVSWLVLRSELGRAIPESFLRGLKQAGIEPLIQLQPSFERLPDLNELALLLEVYARWGARYLVFYDRPNTRAAWPAASWAQQDLVERFLDRYLPAANLALQTGLTPVFPALEPGGSYWDTAFLRSALQAIQRRKQDALLQNLVLSAYAWTGARSLDWGAGGPERWPQARPYLSSDEGQDQRGFRIFDWYAAVARSVLHRACPMILLQAGRPGPVEMTVDPVAYATTCADITRLLVGEPVADAQVDGKRLEHIPDTVISCNLWLLGADSTSPDFSLAWYEDQDHRRPAAEQIRLLRRERQERAAKAKLVQPVCERPIHHYLLLPGAEHGVSDWYLEVIRPFVKKYCPTIGFSPDEAENAERVTVVGNAHSYPEDLLIRLQNAGCLIEQIGGDGTNIATELAER